LAATLVRDKDYEVDEEKEIVIPLEAGIEKVERAVGVENLYEAVSVNYVHQLNQSLRAKELYHRDKDYLVQQGEVKIIDEFTGRTLDGRRWSDGLHQAVEAKERVRINEENHTWATVTLQNYFRLYEKLAGMTGTAETEASEFANTYSLPVVPIPTNKELVRDDKPDVIFRTEAAKFDAVVDDLVERHRTGQPVLVGTASVAKSEVLSRLLERRGVPHQVLNAKQHFREAEVVAQAGRLGAVTVATNMAGRGVDIILGGNAELLAQHEAVARGLDISTEEGAGEVDTIQKELDELCAGEGARVRELGGLYVLGSERHESRRIDNQLRGRSGRQGDPGESRFYLSLEDDLMRLFATGAMNWVMTKALPEDTPIEAKMVTKSIERAQNTVEGKNAEQRKEVLKYDEVMNEQRKVIYARRSQVIDGEDLQARTEELLEITVEALVRSACPSDYTEEWDLELLINELTQYYPTQFTPEDLAEGTSASQVVASVQTEALEYYETHSASLPGGEETARQIERDVMLQIIDQRWREHLAEMDYLREGINLRAMGQQDPLVAWQREGFSMFGQLMDAIDDDYLRYVLHVEALAQQTEEPDLARAVYEAADDPVASTQAIAPLMLADRGSVDQVAAPVPPAGNGAAPSRTPAAQQAAGRPASTGGPRGAHAKPGRNDPCSCGSGKKYKLCHGAA
jgi:preprotein translocase subunit SecA